MSVTFTTRDRDGTVTTLGTWEMTNVPRVGDWVHLDLDDVAWQVRDVSWELNTQRVYISLRPA